MIPPTMPENRQPCHYMLCEEIKHHNSRIKRDQIPQCRRTAPRWHCESICVRNLPLTRMDSVAACKRGARVRTGHRRPRAASSFRRQPPPGLPATPIAASNPPSAAPLHAHGPVWLEARCKAAARVALLRLPRRPEPDCGGRPAERVDAALDRRRPATAAASCRACPTVSARSPPRPSRDFCRACYSDSRTTRDPRIAEIRVQIIQTCDKSELTRAGSQCAHLPATDPVRLCQLGSGRRAAS